MIIRTKINYPTGQYSAFHDPIIDLKYGKSEIGLLDYEKPHKIHLQVIKEDINEDGNSNSEWKWITLKAKFGSLDEARKFLKEKTKSILDKYNIRFSEN